MIKVRKRRVNVANETIFTMKGGSMRICRRCMILTIGILGFIESGIVFAEDAAQPNRLTVRLRNHIDVEPGYPGYQAGAMDGENLWIAVKEMPAQPDFTAITKLRLLAIDTQGNRTRDINLNTLCSRSNENDYILIMSVIASNGGELLIAAKDRSDKWAVIKISSQGEIIFERHLNFSPYSVVIAKLILLDDASYLFMGTQKGKAYYGKMTSDGKIAWEKTIDHGQPEQAFLDGIPTEGGGFVLLGNFGLYNFLFYGPSNSIWVCEFDAQGNLKQESSWTGSMGHIIKSLDCDGCVVVYDKDVGDGQDIYARFLNRDFQVSWDTPIKSIEAGFTDFSISQGQKGQYIIAGDVKTDLSFTALDTTGRVLWSYLDDSARDYGSRKVWIDKQGDVTVTGVSAGAPSDPKAPAKIGILKYATEQQK